jgi:hypothetical protein
MMALRDGCEHIGDEWSAKEVQLLRLVAVAAAVAAQGVRVMASQKVRVCVCM